MGDKTDGSCDMHMNRDQYKADLVADATAAEEMKQVVIVRTDLKMSKGKIAGQVAHGVLGAVLPHQDDSRVHAWQYDQSFVKVICKCDSEKELLALQSLANEMGILECLITDEGRTVFNGVPTKTVLVLGPDVDSVLDPITGHLKLL